MSPERLISVDSQMIRPDLDIRRTSAMEQERDSPFMADRVNSLLCS